MRPTTSTMLQQNNNNNYPCLNMSGSTREMLQKCSRAALPFPSRLELGDLPLIRGLRAWALCSKNRRKAGGLLGGRQAPTAPHAGRENPTSSSKPAGVYLSEEWGRMGYGLPLGLDARQAEIGALVTIATLKTSEGSGKTQTQCLFLQTEKGSCLYSTAKPGSGVTTNAGSSVVGGWLRGKTGGGRDTPAARRDTGPNPPAQTGANRVRVGSGRRWRKSGNAAGREKPVLSRERQHRSREDPAGEITLEERKEVQDKGALDSKQSPSPQQDSKKARQDKEGVCRTPRCCHNASPKTCTQCRRRAQRRESQEEQEGGESPNSEKKGMRKERQKNEEEGGVCELRSSNLVLAAPDPDLESSPERPSGCDDEAKCDEELKRQNFHSKDDFSEKEQETNSDIIKIPTGNNDFIRASSEKLADDFELRHDRSFDGRKPAENPCEDVVAGVNEFSDCMAANQEFEREMESADVEEEERSITHTPTESAVVSNCCEDVAVSSFPASISTAFFPESSAPLEGSIFSACWDLREQGSIQEAHLERYQKWEEDHRLMGKEELDEVNVVADERNTVLKLNNNGKAQVFFQTEENELSSSPLRHKDPSISETDGWSDCQTPESERMDELLSEADNVGKILNPESGNEAGEHKLDDGNTKGGNDKEQYTEDEINISAIQEDNYEIKRNCTPTDKCTLKESADGSRKRKTEDGDTCSQTSITHVEANGKTSTNVTNVACADPFTSPALSLANPAPPLPPLGSMATGLPCVVAEEEKEEEEEDNKGVGVTARDREGGQEGKRRHRGELEEQGEGERGSTVATEEGRKEEEEGEGEEDEFGVFMQAEGEPAWSEGFAMSASVPCGSRDSVALGSRTITRESTHWTPGWTDGSFPQSDDTWTAFPPDSSDGGGDVVGQWWPTGAVEERRDGRSASQNVVCVFAEAFPSPPGSSSSDPRGLDTVHTLTQLLRGRASQDQGLLDSFHDLNKMIGQRFKRASSVSRDLLLKTLHVEQPQTESRHAPWTANRRLSPGLPSANQHAQNAAAKRRLSYDYNRNIME